MLTHVNDDITRFAQDKEILYRQDVDRMQSEPCACDQPTIFTTTLSKHGNEETYLNIRRDGISANGAASALDVADPLKDHLRKQSTGIAPQLRIKYTIACTMPFLKQPSRSSDPSGCEQLLCLAPRICQIECVGHNIQWEPVHHASSAWRTARSDTRCECLHADLASVLLCEAGNLAQLLTKIICLPAHVLHPAGRLH